MKDDYVISFDGSELNSMCPFVSIKNGSGCEPASNGKFRGFSLNVGSLSKLVAIHAVHKLLNLKRWIEMFTFVTKTKIKEMPDSGAWNIHKSRK